MAPIGELLFHRSDRFDLYAYLSRQDSGIKEAINRLNLASFENKSDEEIIQSIAETLQLLPLTVDYASATAAVQETTMEWEDHFFGERSIVPALRVTKSLPFQGNADLWHLKPNEFDFNPPRGQVNGKILIVGITVPTQQADTAQSYIEETIKKIPEWIERQSRQIGEYNSNLSKKIGPLLKARKEQSAVASNLLKTLQS